MVYVLDKHKKPLMPCTGKRARLLLERGQAVVHRMAPFTIRLKDRLVEDSVLQPPNLKVDPGSKVTGGAVIRDEENTIGLHECHHRTDIKDKIDARRAQRRSRRGRKTRYREPRFNNRHPAKCAACGKNARHGSRYCRPCAGARNFVDTGHRETRLPPSLQARVDETMSWIDKIRAENFPKALKQLKEPLKDAAMMNATRWTLYRRLKDLGLPLETGSGGLTKYNRSQVLKLPKTQYYDAVCVGTSLPKTVDVPFVECHTAVGRGNRQIAGVDEYGFPFRWRERKKVHHGFQTGDIVTADVPKGKYKGIRQGRVAVRATGYFDIKNGIGKRSCQGIAVRFFHLL